MAEAPASTTTFIDKRGSPNILIRILWFIFVGWWASFIVITLAALVNLTVIGIPLGIWLMNRIPQVVTLKLDNTRYTIESSADGNTVITAERIPQRPFWQRALWYLLVGWWTTIIWLYLAWFLCVIVIGMPLAFPMFGFTGKLLTLKR